MALNFISPVTIDKQVLIPAVAGQRIRLLRILASSSVVRWVKFTSAASELDTGTQMISDLLISNLFTLDIPYEEKYAVSTEVGEGIYIELSSSGGKTEITSWYDVVPA